MIRGLETVMLNSQNAKKLASFYRDIVGLTPGMEFVGGEKEESYFEFVLGNCSLMIADHSKVKGKQKDADRMFLNLEVDDLEKEVARLKKHKVKIIADIYHVEEYGLIATLEDPDGNYFQLVQVRPTPSQKKAN